MTRKIFGALLLFGNVAYVLHWIETGEPVYAVWNAMGAYFSILLMGD